MRITVANLKGGVGKTTTAMGLAVAAATLDGLAVLLIDADPQASARGWAETASERTPELGYTVVSLPTPELPRRLPKIAGAFQMVIIDTPPGHLGIVTAAISAADVVLVPVQPTLMDIDRVRATVDIATGQGKPAVVLLSRTRTGTRSLVSARDALNEAGFPLLPVEIPQREAIAASWGFVPPARMRLLYGQILQLVRQAVVEVSA